MTIGTGIAFAVVCFMFFAILMKLLGLIWGAIVYGEDKLIYDGRDFWDEDDRKDLEDITADSLEQMGTKSTPIEIYDPATRYF